MADITAVQNTSTLNKYIKSKVDPIFTKSIFMAGLKAHNRISYGVTNSGKKLKWRPRVKRRTIKTASANAVDITFEPTNVRIPVELPWMSYNLGEKISKMDRLVNQGNDVQYVNHVQDVISGLSEDFIEDFASKIYEDASATGSEELHGLETMMSQSGAVADGFVGVCDGSYAGQSTVLGAIGGTWTTGAGSVWPQGSGKREYGAWTPMIVDYTNSGFGGTAHTWADQWQDALGFAVGYLGTTQNQKPDICILNTQLLLDAKNSLREKERFVATSKSKLVDAGFTTLNFEGLELGDEYNVPAATGYVFSWENIELMSMQKQLVALDKDTVIRTSDDLYAADFYGQIKFQAPSLFAKLEAVS